MSDRDDDRHDKVARLLAETHHAVMSDELWDEREHWNIPRGLFLSYARALDNAGLLATPPECTCVCVDPGKSHSYTGPTPSEWEQAPDCPVHPLATPPEADTPRADSGAVVVCPCGAPIHMCDETPQPLPIPPEADPETVERSSSDFLVVPIVPNDETVERVAKAMWDAVPDLDGDGEVAPWDEIPEYVRQMWRAKARVAIRAMREGQ